LHFIAARSQLPNVFLGYLIIRVIGLIRVRPVRSNHIFFCQLYLRIITRCHKLLIVVDGGPTVAGREHLGVIRPAASASDDGLHVSTAIHVHEREADGAALVFDLVFGVSKSAEKDDSVVGVARDQLLDHGTSHRLCEPLEEAFG